MATPDAGANTDAEGDLPDGRNAADATDATGDATDGSDGEAATEATGDPQIIHNG